MLKKIAAAALVAGTLSIVAAPAMAETLCLDGEVTVNDVTQTIHQCV
jgi:hypothetical protein